jgi:hypothetical protein
MGRPSERETKAVSQETLMDMLPLAGSNLTFRNLEARVPEGNFRVLTAYHTKIQKLGFCPAATLRGSKLPFAVSSGSRS